MALVVKDRVQETTTTTGTGTITLAGAVNGFQSFSAIGNANTTYYAIVGGTQWEVGLGTYTSSGTTLSRDTVLASSTGSKLDLAAGTKNVFVTYPAGKSLYTDASGNAISLGTPVSATLTNATGLPISTGVSGLGTNVATFLASPSSVNLASAVSDDTGSGALVFANTPTLVSPILGTPTSGVLSACTVDGSNKVGYLNIPQSGSIKTGSYTLATTDIGEFIEVGTGGSIVVPNSTFTVGDSVVIFNNTSGAVTLNMSIATAYIGGTDSDKATISLATRGICNVMFISGTVCVVTGNVA